MPAPANDNLVNAQFFAQGATLTVDTTDATAEADEATYLGATYTTPSVWYQFVAAQTGIATITGTFTSGNPFVEVFKDDSTPTYPTLVRQDGAEATWSGTTYWGDGTTAPPVWKFPTVANQRYYLYAGTYDTGTVQFTFTVGSEATGVSIAFYDDPLTANPEWVPIHSQYVVQSWTIDRGRQSEWERTDTGRATITMLDLNGDFDPTNPDGAFYGWCLPRKQVGIALTDPVTGESTVLFRGIILAWRYEPHVSQRCTTVTIECADHFAYFAQYEMTSDGTFGFLITDGNIVFDEDSALDAVQSRLVALANQAGWPGSGANDVLRDINSGNVALAQATYAVRESVLDAMMDCAWAEFPPVSNLYMSKDGKLTFQGRYARFHPDNPDYNIDTWVLGDEEWADSNSAAVISPPFEFRVDEADVYNVAVAWPAGIPDADIPGQRSEDATSIATYGARTWSAENLLTAGGVGPTTGLEECQLFQQYVIQNYADARARLSQVTVRPQPPSAPWGPETWAFLCGVELSDLVTIRTSPVYDGAAGTRGFQGVDYFVEGLHYTAYPQNADHPEVTLTVDVSPRARFDTNPFTEPA